MKTIFKKNNGKKIKQVMTLSGVITCFLLSLMITNQLYSQGDGTLHFDLSLIEQIGRERENDQYLSKDFNIPIFTYETKTLLETNKIKEQEHKSGLLGKLFLGEEKISGTISPNNDIFQDVPISAQRQQELVSEYFDMTVMLIPLVITIISGLIILLVYAIYKANRTSEMEV